MQSITIYKRLMGYVRPYWLMIIAMVIATAIYASTSALIVSIMQPIIDEGFIDKNINTVYMSVLALIGITLVRGISFFTSSYCSRWVSSVVVFDIRQEMFTQLQSLPTPFFDKHNTGEVLSKFNYDVLQVTAAAINALKTIVQESITIITLLGFLFYYNWILTLSILVVAPVIGLIISKVSKRLRRLAKKIQGDMGNMTHILDENIKGQKIVKIFHGQQYEKKRFYRANKSIKQSSIKSEVASALSTPIVELIVTAVLCFVIIIMAKQAREGNISSGQFITYIGMMAMLSSPIKKLTSVNESLQKGLAAAESIFHFIDEVTEEPITEQATEIAPELIPKIRGEISFHNVCFSYEDELVLNNFNLDIKAGETIALVGSSGSGKSSIANLLPRFYEIQSGSIKIDGINISDLNLNFLRSQFSFVNQDNILFNDSIYKNIAYGMADESINVNKLNLSSKIANATEFINQLDGGVQYRIGESGQGLSGGQQQRLSIARAVYKNAPIFILDEATSALDSESEQKVQFTLNKLIKNRTAIIIAHRLSTIKSADRIIVLDKGNIIEQGTHQTLIESKGQYYKLYQMSNL